MFKTYRAFVQKEVWHILRDPRTLFILFGMPIALVLIFGYTVTNEFKNASIAVVDESKDDLSRLFIEHLTSSGHLRLVETPQSAEDLDAAFRAGKIKMGVIIPPDFERRFWAGQPVKTDLITDASDPNYATTLTNYAAQMIQSFPQKAGVSAAQAGRLQIHPRMLYNPKLVGAFNFIPGVVALILMLISAMMTSLTIAREKESGTMDLLLVSPLPPLLIILGKVTPYVALSFINAVMVFAMGYYIFGVPVRGSLALLLGLCLLYLLVALSLGVLISTKSETQQAAMMGSLFTLLMPTVLLSGFMFPIASMPTVLQYIAQIVPAHYFLLIEQSIMLKGAGWQTLLRPVGILCLMLFVLLLAAWRNFKLRDQ
ncbi:MAG: ABC transporter permease [Bacteroidetes bacterium]|nr:MAG: ABC transporter permease [Bacteroidota bacterium]